MSLVAPLALVWPSYLDKGAFSIQHSAQMEAKMNGQTLQLENYPKDVKRTRKVFLKVSRQKYGLDKVKFADRFPKREFKDAELKGRDLIDTDQTQYKGVLLSTDPSLADMELPMYEMGVEITDEIVEWLHKSESNLRQRTPAEIFDQTTKPGGDEHPEIAIFRQSTATCDIVEQAFEDAVARAALKKKEDAENVPDGEEGAVKCEEEGEGGDGEEDAAEGNTKMVRRPAPGRLGRNGSPRGPNPKKTGKCRASSPKAAGAGSEDNGGEKDVVQQDIDTVNLEHHAFGPEPYGTNMREVSQALRRLAERADRMVGSEESVRCQQRGRSGVWTPKPATTTSPPECRKYRRHR